MFGLTRDFIQQDGIYMMLGEPEGMPVGKLNMVQARMLMNTDIPHHLRLLLREIDLKITLEYAVSRKKMLSHLLKSEKLNLNSFFGLLLQIAHGIEDGRLYMLRMEQYALHEDYIFIEGSLQSGKVYLTYIPVQGQDLISRPGDSFKALIMVLMASITELTGGGVQRLLKYCGEEEFTAAGLKDLLSELLTEGDSSVGRTNIVEELDCISPSIEKAPPESDRWAVEKRQVNNVAPTLQATMERNAGKVMGTLQNTVQGVSNYPSLRIKEQVSPGTQEDIESTNTQPSSTRTYIILGCLLVDALLWKFLYLNAPSPLYLAVCGVITLVLAVLSWMVWNGRLKLGRAENEEFMRGEIENTNRKENGFELEWDFGRNPVTSVRAAVNPKPHFTHDEERTEGRSPIKEPVPIAATTLLSQEKVPEKDQVNQISGRVVPYLKRCDDLEGGDSETIELNRSSFIIGRSAEVAQYVERSEGTSRVHAEISRCQGGYILKDLDSRNGTIYQGEPMIPYKEYPLTEGAAFKIVKGSYTFHTA